MNSDKPVLTISMAAHLLGLHPRTLMLYENTGLIKPYRTNTQRRLFSIRDLDRLQFVKFLTQQNGVNLAGVKVLFEAFILAEKGGIDLQKGLFTEFQPVALL